MKNVWVVGGAALAALALASSAQADDSKTAPLADSTAAVSPWNSFYFGVGIGSRNTRSEVTTTALNVFIIPSIATNPAPLNSGDTVTAQIGSLRTTLYLGYNWLIAPKWVVGIEADGGFSDKASTFSGFPSSPRFGNTGDPADNLSVKTTWDASLRGRVGFLFTPVTLAYATGGAAMQRFEVTSVCGFTFCDSKNFAPTVISKNVTKGGWTIGGGIEIALWDHLLARAEYRYAEFRPDVMFLARSEQVVPFTAWNDTFETTVRTQTVTFGLAYSFH